MAVQLVDLRDMVNAELENRAYRGSAEVTGDGETGAFLVPPIGFSILNNTIFSVYKNDVLLAENVGYTMDFVSGVCSLTSVPATTDVIEWNFEYVAFPNATVDAAIESGVQAMFPSLYIADIATATTTSGVYEYNLPETVEFVSGVEFRTSTTSPWMRKKRDRYELYTDETHKVLQFYADLGTGYLRIKTIERPAALGVNSLEDIGLPARASGPIVSYSCWYLLTQKLAPRVRSEVAIATQGQGTVYPTQMNVAIQAFLMRYQFQLQSIKQPPWSAV